MIELSQDITPNNPPFAPIIRVEGLQKQYGKFLAVKGINFEVYPGEIFGLIGPDGAGKTSTFHILGGVMEASGGNIDVLGKKPRNARLNVGYLTQQFSLYLDLSIDENLRYTAGLRRVSEVDFQQRRDKYLKLMGLERIALMYEGQIHEIGTLPQLRSNLGLQRLEIRTKSIAAVERALLPLVNLELTGIADVQTFGDRLDILVRDPQSATIQVRDALSDFSIDSIQTTEATLENVFVTRLRQQGSDPAFIPLPGASQQKPLHASSTIAIGARDLYKTFGNFRAVKGVNLNIHYGEIYGLLGANGAGKTTVIKMLCGLLPSTSGELSLAGQTQDLRSGDLRRQFWRLIEDLAQRGTAVLVTTHYLEEAEQCNRMGFMVAGEMVLQGSPSEIKVAQPGQLIELRVDRNQQASDILKSHLESWRVAIFGDRLHVVLDRPDTEIPHLQAVLATANIEVRSIRPVPFSLEDAFISVVQRSGTGHTAE